MSSNRSQLTTSTLSISSNCTKSTVSTLSISSNHPVKPPVQGARDAAAVVNTQWDVAPHRDSPQVPRQPHDTSMTDSAVPHQGDQGNKSDVGIQDGGLVPEREEGPPTVHPAHNFLDRTPILVDLSHLPRDVLDRVARYVFDLSLEAGLPAYETEHITFHLLTVGNQNYWDTDTINGVARDVVNNTANGHIHRYVASSEEEFAHFLAVQVPRDIEDSENLYSIGFESRNGTHFRVEVLVSFTLLRNMACSGAVGVVLVIVGRLTWAHYKSIASVVCNILLQLFDRAMVGWEPFVGWSDLRSFIVAPVSILLIYMFVKGVQAAARVGHLQA